MDDEIVGGALWLVAVVLQSGVYYLLYRLWVNMRQHRQAGAKN